MEQLPNYNFLQAIDPTKIKVPINERFAKLTLSSNKKQQQKGVEEPGEEQRQHKVEKEKRDSVVRNISKQFANEIHKESPTSVVLNPVLRSESSKENECNKSLEESAVAEDLSMEPLEITEDDEENNAEQVNDLELLSQQMASLMVEKKPISLSSGSTCNLSVCNDLISSESQPSHISEADQIHIVHHIPIVVNEAVKQETIPLNLTSGSANDKSENRFEMTEDADGDGEEDEYSEEEDKPITISDTSDSHHEPDVLDIMAISSLPSTSVTSENLRLPSVVADKAELVAAFLRDVSIQHRIINEQGQVVVNDTIDKILDNKEIDKIEKARQIATADTESMTPDIGEEVTPKSVVERGKRLKALEDVAENKVQGKKGIMQNVDIALNAETPDITLDTGYHKGCDDETPKAPLKPRKTIKNCTPQTPKTRATDVYRLANDETQCNTDLTFQKEAYFTDSSFKESPQNENKEQLYPRRLANDDTMANSLNSDLDDCGTISQVYKNSERVDVNLTPVNSNENSIASDMNSIHEPNDTVPEASITILETDDDNSSLIEVKSCPKNANSDDQKLSNSFHKEESSDDSEYEQKVSKIQMSMASINISAKINIKIHIPQITSSSSEDEKYDEPQTPDNKVSRRLTDQTASKPSEQQNSSNDDYNNEGNEPSNESEISEHEQSSDRNSKSSNNCLLDKAENVQKEVKSLAKNHSYKTNNQRVEFSTPQKHCNKAQIKTPIEEIVSPTSKSSDSSMEIVEDKKFLTEAEKLLNQLYGESWQTPDVIRTLKRTSQTSDKKPTAKFSSKVKTAIKAHKTERSDKKSLVEESVLDDFSMFRRNIVKTNLDSTRLASPNAAMQQARDIFTEPRTRRSPLVQKTVPNAQPQTERKPRTTKRTVCTNKWRQLIDKESNSEGDNASDDDDLDESWSRNALELEVNSSDSNFEISPKPKNTKDNKNTTKTPGRSAKSDYLTKVLNKSKYGEIVYLDLSKQEVEVQEVPASPPANNDLTFASRLQDILRTCRREEKARLPSSSDKKSKRKLFTPQFSYDDFEVLKPKEDEIKHKEVDKENDNNDDILEDSGNCPFDSLGRPKVFELVNKPLESVKAAKPIFQLTPSPKKKHSKLDIVTPTSKSATKAKSNDEVKFKTPSTTIKSKTQQTKGGLKDLMQTPDYKYSFLKSLDVAVCKTLCHPDALYYRNNFRTKKEELSKILYDMYNEKLFDNKLDVSLRWNKKLLNTAGRCLNKKKLGIRSSAVELSEKVLTSADRLRCTLIHELCHAATWVFNGEGGHGSTWKEWARRANCTFPEIPKIGVCHQYDIEYKYTYKCTLCAAKSHAHSKSKKVENIRCSYCHGAIEVFLNKKDKDGNVMPTPVKEATGFAKFVKENYKKYKRDDLKHADVMKLLSNEFASLKVTSN